MPLLQKPNCQRTFPTADRRPPAGLPLWAEAGLVRPENAYRHKTNTASYHSRLPPATEILSVRQTVNISALPNAVKRTSPSSFELRPGLRRGKYNDSRLSPGLPRQVRQAYPVQKQRKQRRFQNFVFESSCGDSDGNSDGAENPRPDYAARGTGRGRRMSTAQRPAVPPVSLQFKPRDGLEAPP